jgi:acyl-CoA synthetase (AMP-forming)/AMP-acid ligase II
MGHRAAGDTLPLAHQPGTSYAYSNFGYCVLGRVIEKITGESYEAHVRKAVLAPMEIGQDIHLIDRWDPTRALGIMLEAGIGAGTGASVFLSSILDHPDFSPEHAQHMRRVGLGGAPVPLALAERAASYDIAIIRAYGSTEHPSITGCSFDDPVDKRHATDGYALPGVEIRLLDDDGVAVPAGEPGEIWSRGPDLCVGYTDPTLGADAFDDDGWYRTGDMGVLDAESFLTITDRLKDVIIRGGRNIHPARIEALAMTHDAVEKAAAFAVADPRLGERVCLAVVARKDMQAEPEAILRHLDLAGLSKHDMPEFILPLEEMPLTASGKVIKRELARWVEEGCIRPLPVRFQSPAPALASSPSVRG